MSLTLHAPDEYLDLYQDITDNKRKLFSGLSMLWTGSPPCYLPQEFCPEWEAITAMSPSSDGQRLSVTWIITPTYPGPGRHPV
ncbi:hypothetical protein RRG08_004787 [Elysia crispata]|uniref:Uncharacterized protein n=1 Tax=Elysia crispata TaxID=231223 RepID=A0AAE1BAP1_9GAST|nr:hypothetical protein RRG08_004787 [Elysia crispata]